MLRAEPVGNFIRNRLGQEQPCGYLRVEGLGGGHAHLDVSTIGGIQDPISLIGQVAPPPVDDS
ncbi:unannotated protein [freshwater metagenome]|uniref:Unannotated protein n=1 Tax=freshwater metagenome TaxID=449393 RepID=A0A6J7PGV8_9ZZZZ